MQNNTTTYQMKNGHLPENKTMQEKHQEGRPLTCDTISLDMVHKTVRIALHPRSLGRGSSARYKVRYRGRLLSLKPAVDFPSVKDG